jgi:Astacin (Peptidase family M12A)/FG-GAP-like repeat/FG-GAP repeat
MQSAKRIHLIAFIAVVGLGCAALRAQDDPAGSQGPPPPPPRPGYVLVDDMWLPEWALGAESTYLGTPWPGGNVYVILSDQFSSTQKDLIRKAWAELEAVCGVDFFEVTQSFSGDHIAIIPNTGYPNVSSSEVGMVGGEQFLRVGGGHLQAGDKFVLVHEFMHALGFKHEQQRPDRDSFVTILTNNISQTACNGGSCNGNFDILGSEATTYTSYDFLSIMHYRGDSFSIGDTLTIQCHPSFAIFQNQLGNRSFLSTGDLNGLQAKYGPPSAPVINTVVPNAVAATTQSSLLITVNGQNFFEGSLDPENGLQGTVVTVNGIPVATDFVNENQVTGHLTWGFLQTPGPLAIAVSQGAPAGGPSAGSVTFTVLPPPCTASSDRVGQAVAGLGDVDGDGKGDYVVGIPGWGSDQGRVLCYSGATGATLWSYTGLTAGNKAGFAIAAIGDVNGDGKKDVLVGSPGYPGTDAGRVEIRSGATGSSLATLNNGTAAELSGWAVAGIGDVEGDGDADFAIGKPGYNNSAGRVEIWSSNGGLIRAHNGSAAGDRFGQALGGGYDVSQDGVADYVVGAPEKVIGGLASVGRVYVYSGSTGGLLISRDGDSSYDRFGYDVALIPTTSTAGDYGQILVGAPEIGNFFTLSGNGPGYVRLFHHNSLLSGYSTLATWTGSVVGDRYGLSVASAGDVNDDGYPDILVGIPQSNPLYTPVGPGGFDIRSGKTYDVLYHYQGGANDEQLGFAVDGCGDVDGDARLDVIVGAPGSDVGCIDAGAFAIIHPPVPPEIEKVMITEVSTGNPDCVEITNFGTSSVSLGNWKIRWKDGSTSESALSGTLLAGHTVVVSETTSLAECPAGVPILSLTAVGTTTGDVAVALVNNRNVTVDEVHLESTTGVYGEGSLGGLFRGLAVGQLTGPGEVNAERIWGLDSNGGSDWTTGAVRSMGLQNRSTGTSRGLDPIAVRFVRINETDDNLDYLELHRPAPPLPYVAPLDVQGWYLLASAGQNVAHARLNPFPNPLSFPTGGYVVLGDSATAPPEMPGSASYVDLAAVGGGNIPWVGSEYDCALYDSYGRLVDTFRSTTPSLALAHNHPRAPSRWTDFSGAAPRTATGAAALGRNATATDTNTGADFAPQAVRTMGAANTSVATWVPDSTPQLNVVLNDNQGGGFTAIITAGGDRAGQKWTMTFSIGHMNGAGPVAGYGPDILDNWLLLSVTPPFFGFLDAEGSGRVDLPAGTLPAGVQADFAFILQDGAAQLAPITQISKILEFDS